MAWVKLDDGFLDHPKFLEAGPVAGFVAICAMAWSNRNLTDGFIPGAQVARLANLEGVIDELRGPQNDYINAGSLATALVEAGLWTPAEGGYQIHDYHDHQPTADAIRSKRARDRARKNNGTGEESPRHPRGIRTESTTQEVRSKNPKTTPPPCPPQGGRARDRSRYEKELASFAAEHFPGTPAGLVGHHAERLRRSKIEPTVEALRPFIEESVAA